MERFFAILLSAFGFIRWAAVGLALYGWVWLPRFQSGTWGGPYWMLSLYDRAIPLLLGIGAVGFVIIWLYQGLFGLFGAKTAATSQSFRGIFFWLVVIIIIGGIPSFMGNYQHLQEVVFHDGRYHLIQRDNGATANYLVFHCADPMGLWCRQIAVSPNVPAPPPTPVPLPTATSDPMGIQPTPTPIPTVTPPAKLITDTMDIELSIQIGNFRAPITNTETLEE